MDNRWKILTEISQLDTIVSDSNRQPQIIFKHSTRCSISSMALKRLEGLGADFYDSASFYYLDLIAYREVSNAIADRFHVYHESPQVILVKQGDATYDASHMEITVQELINEL